MFRIIRVAIFATTLAGCVTAPVLKSTGGGNRVTETDRRAVCELLDAIYRPQERHLPIITDATPVKLYDKVSVAQLNARLHSVRVDRATLRATLSADANTQPSSSPNIVIAYRLASGCMADVSSPGPSEIDFSIDVRHEPDGSRIFDLLWLKTRDEDFFRLPKNGRAFYFFSTGPDAS